MKKKSNVERATPLSKKSAARALAVGAGSAFWCWTDYEDAEYWSPGGTREDAISRARKQLGQNAKFWIAPTRPATKAEREEYECSGMVDIDKVERISPNAKAHPTAADKKD